MRMRGFTPIVIIIFVAVIGIVGYYFFGAKNSLFKPTPTPVPSTAPTAPPISKFNFQVTTTVKPQATSKPTVANVNTTGKLAVTFHPLYTQENIESFAVKIFKVGESTPMLSSTGYGKTYTAGNIPEGNYLIFVQAGRGDKYCGVSGNGTNATTVQFSIKPGEQTNLDLNIYPYPGFVYLKTKNGFPIANATVSTGYYSTNTDNLGRAVVYNINPGPYTLNFSYSGGNFSQQITGDSCLYIQSVSSPLDTPLSTVKISINSTVKTGNLGWEFIIKSTSLDIKPNAVGQNLDQDTIRKYSFRTSKCAGLDGSYLNFSNLFGSGSAQQSYFMVDGVETGSYGVCLYNADNPDSSYASSVPQIQVSGGSPVEVTVDYPRK